VQIQQEDFQPLGRDYKTVQQGDVIGRKGTLEIAIMATQRGEMLKALREFGLYTGQVYLKSPFGEVFAIDVGDISIEFVGVGGVKVTMPYTENGIV
jgi:hypothetical protein